MKKSKLSLGLVTSFIGALALTSCGSDDTRYYISPSLTSIVDFIGYNSATDKLTVDVDKFYSEYGDSEVGTNLFYNAVLESLIRYEYKGLSEDHSDLKAYATIEKEANEKVIAQQDIALANAGSDGDYETELAKIFKSFNVENIQGLKEHFVYELEKEALSDWYLKTSMPEVKDQYLGIESVSVTDDQNNTVTHWDPIEQGADKEYASVFPYHIQHILVNLGADANDYTRATITEAEAKKLYEVVRKLISGKYSFEEVAFKHSDDSSKSSFGDAGIMSTQTNFVNEFKLGIYAYDAILSGVNSELPAEDDQGTKFHDSTEAIYKAFGLDADAQIKVGTTVTDDHHVENKYKNVQAAIKSEMRDNVKTAITGYIDDQSKFDVLPTVPWDVFRKLNDYAEESETEYKFESSSASYPRNVLFNQFLNFRSPFIITNEDLGSFDGVDDKITTSVHDFQDDQSDLYLESDNFKGKDVTGINLGTIGGDEVKALTTSNNDVVIGVRSTYGIHFMVMRKSVFKGTNEKSTYIGKDEQGQAVVKTKDNITLQDYYTTDTPDAHNYPESTYVNWATSDDPSYYTKRADTIKNKLKGSDSGDVFDAAYDYRIYTMLLEAIGEDKITFFDSSKGDVVSKNIKDKIDNLRANKFDSNETTLNQSWEDYLTQLAKQNYFRGLLNKDVKLLPSKCVFLWGKANAGEETAQKAFEEGGDCYAK